MKLEEQVTSLELSKQLEEAGYKQEGLWESVGTPYGEGRRWLMLRRERLSREREFIDIVIRPTCAELGEALPREIVVHNFDWRFEQLKREKWECGYRYYQRSIYEDADTEANARAKCWLFLKKEGLL